MIINLRDKYPVRKVTALVRTYNAEKISGIRFILEDCSIYADIARSYFYRLIKGYTFDRVYREIDITIEKLLLQEITSIYIDILSHGIHYVAERDSWAAYEYKYRNQQTIDLLYSRLSILEKKYLNIQYSKDLVSI